MKIAHEIYQKPSEKIFTVSLIRDLEKGVIEEEITYSRMVEILNCIASMRVDEWKRYAEDMEAWRIKYKDDHSMDAAMSRPNKPGYYRANND